MNGSTRSSLLPRAEVVAALCAVFAVFAVFGCASRPLAVAAAPDPVEAAACPGAGAARLAGSSFARQRNGGIVSGAGRTVILDPVTRYSTAVYRAITEHQNKSSFFKFEKDTQTVALDAAMLKCRRTAPSDAEGKFAFENVAPGAYFVGTYISWLTPAGEWLGTWNVALVNVPADAKPLDVVLSGVPESIPDPARR